MERPSVAIAHDYLTQRGGAERVVLVLAEAFPDAPISTTLYDPDGTFPEFRGRDIRTSWGNRIGWLRRHHRAALPLLPWMSNTLRVDADVVIASSSGWAHGFPTDGRRVVYCYSPARWLYQPEVYLGADAHPAVRLMLRLLGPAHRRWDRRRSGWRNGRWIRHRRRNGQRRFGRHGNGIGEREHGKRERLVGQREYAWFRKWKQRPRRI